MEYRRKETKTTENTVQSQKKKKNETIERDKSSRSHNPRKESSNKRKLRKYCREQPLDFTEISTEPTFQIDEDIQIITKVAVDFLLCYQKSNHCDPRCLRLLAMKGIISSRLAECSISVCSVSLDHRVTRRLGTKKSRTTPPSVPTQPGQVLGVEDTRNHRTNKRFTTKERYRRLLHIHFHDTAYTGEAIEAKETFEHKTAGCKLNGVVAKGSKIISS